jgi:AcrR family transcriptional regulator
MPKFTQKEKEVIFSKLRTSGEELFTKYGLKKVTVDDIAERVGIGKGTFYHFYSNKEHLFMDIFNHAQEEIYEGIEEFFQRDGTGQEKALSLIRYLLCKFKDHPMLSIVSGEDFELLQCKVPEECLLQNDIDDRELMMKAEAAGIVFKYPTEIIMKTVRGVFIIANAYQEDKDGNEVVDLLTRSIVNNLVE